MCNPYGGIAPGDTFTVRLWWFSGHFDHTDLRASHKKLMTDLDALGAAAEKTFGDVPRASHTLTGSRRNRPILRATPPCATSSFAGRLPCERKSICWCLHSHQRRSLSGIQTLADKRRLNTTGDNIALLFRSQTPHPPSQHPVELNPCLFSDEPVRIYAMLVMRPWVMQAYRSTASCLIGTTRIPRMLGRL